MSKLSFVKYQGAGNDFILIDDRAYHFDSELVPSLCHRKFGVGANGVILLQPDFRMRIYNSDGTEAQMCGNGLCCFMKFLLDLGFPKKKYQIITAGRVVEAGFHNEKIVINMGPVDDVKQLYIQGREVHFLDTGVPHAVIFVPDVDGIDLMKEGPFFRHHPEFYPKGANVNFAAIQVDGTIRVRTYERGVEEETLACGTGAVAVAVSSGFLGVVQTVFAGGVIEVSTTEKFPHLLGSAVRVFSGELP